MHGYVCFFCCIRLGRDTVYVLAPSTLWNDKYYGLMVSHLGSFV
uniref:Uncharacterized protein n=1 Tax=Arundo donax TaxID=35708 RepID=A0A0A8YSC2_ARUDO